MNGTGDTIINAMSDKDLAELKGKYQDNASVVLLIDGILSAREKEAIQAKVMAKFVAGIAKTFKALPHPDDVYNVYARWAEVETEVGEAVAVEVVATQAVLDKDGNIIQPAIMATEMRVPKVTAYQWVVETNHATKTTTTPSADQPKTSKRAITVFKRSGTTLEPKGNFPNASKACEHLKLIIGGDSATRVLARDGYITEAYDGTEFIS